jgi:hypothetical protein
VRTVPVVKTDNRGCRLFFCVNVMFICESSVSGKDRMQRISCMFFCEPDIYL